MNKPGESPGTFIYYPSQVHEYDGLVNYLQQYITKLTLNSIIYSVLTVCV